MVSSVGEQLTSSGLEGWFWWVLKPVWMDNSTTQSTAVESVSSSFSDRSVAEGLLHHHEHMDEHDGDLH